MGVFSEHIIIGGNSQKDGKKSMVLSPKVCVVYSHVEQRRIQFYTERNEYELMPGLMPILAYFPLYTT